MTEDFQKLMAQMMAQGAEMAKAAGVDPKAMPDFGSMADWMPTMPPEMMEMFMGKTMNPEGLDAKTRLLCTLSGFVAQGAVAEDQIRVTVRHALAAGATPQEVIEVIAQMAALAGVPAMTKAMELARVEIDKTEESKA
ncbi:carboxymuconolactone decarboxylase family protein [Alphaproteobacteria bacterium KMM 3653]|uniref:Carboxymuconolactone decarboxylase family protein n=1 Tax=Harenicola maris TaxID=2841044 RepID=A0AAP2CKW3_9RHOB|nr:carboxymuconolactone decarboxylase family protein [Harenicola maris]